MIHEDITISGSFQASGSFILPRIPSNSLASATTGSMFYDSINDVVKIYTGTGSTTDGYITVGEQSAPATSGGGGGGSDDIEYLVIAGGSSGGVGTSRSGGGGGAGGYLSSSLSDIESGSQITVTVGAGGATKTSQGQGNDGSDSTLVSAAGTSFTTVTAIGGGGGGYPGDGRDGGSGGGGAHGGTSGGSGTVGQGNDGGDGSGEAPYAGAGGGGAGAAGSNSSAGSAGAGGNGLASTITGTSTTRAGGGGGGGSADAAGGTGGGGHGATGTANPAITNTGGGGGGAQDNGGAGGSGVAILSYPTGSITAIGGVKTTRSDGQFVHTFKSSGTLKVGGASFNTVAPGDYFNAVLYLGKGSSKSITGVGFQPDLVWVKERGEAENHYIQDSTRGSTQQIYTNQTAAQFNETTAVTSFDSDGFTMGSYSGINNNGDSYVAWCWKANGGTTSSNSDGTITSTVQVNTDAGFSIVKFTNSSPGSSTRVGHGLGSTPDMILLKRTDGTEDWYMYHTSMGIGKFMRLNLTNAQGTASNLFNTVNSTVFNPSFTGTSGQEIIAYCFAEVAGYSKFGSYTGDGNAGKAITTGFRPGFILIKSTVGADNWRLYDTTRGISDGGYLEPNRSDADDTSNAPNITVTDTGFTITAGGVTVGNNVDGNLYIYWAIAN